MKKINYRGYTGQKLQRGTLSYDHGVLMLGSGMLDTAGVEVYEDDVVIREGDIGLVYYENAAFMIQWADGVVKRLGDQAGFITIIGNIHEQE